MPSMVTAIFAAGRNWTIDYSAGHACDVVIKVFTCIKTAWNRVRNMFATVLTTITAIWRPVLRLQSSTRRYPQLFSLMSILVSGCYQDINCNPKS